MRFMARVNTLWKDDSGHTVKVVAGSTVVESERNLENDRPPFFYRVDSEKAEANTDPKTGYKVAPRYFRKAYDEEID